MTRFFLILSVIIFIASCTSRNSKISAAKAKDTLSYDLPKEYPNSIYLGRVTGSIADSFKRDKYSIWKDSLFKLTTIIQSNKPLVIRFFTTNFWSDTSYCIILSYDTAFSIRALRHYFVYEKDAKKSENQKSVLAQVPVHAKADSIFEKLVENGVFSFNMSPSKTNYSKYPILELTKNGFVNGSEILGVDDGVAFLLQYKVDKYYDEVGINNPATYFDHNPDFQIYRRKYEITKALLSVLK
jgi:hypothetical protein